MSAPTPDEPSPPSATEIDPEWLIDALSHSGVRVGDRLLSVRALPLEAGTGAFGSLFRLELTYRRAAPDAPASLVLKTPSALPANRDRALALDLYRREARFYRDAAPSVRMHIPRCYWAGLGGDRGHASVLLEDLRDLSRGDELAGLSLNQSRRALRCIAAIHAQWWEKPQLYSLEWLPRLGSWVEGELVGAYRAAWPGFAQRFAHDLPPGSLDAGARLCDDLEPMLCELSRAPRTLLHGDLRADNLFYDDRSRAGGVTVIDWQLCCRGRGAADVAYLLSQSVSVGLRRRHDAELLRIWHDGLSVGGVTGYSFEDALHDYVRGVQICIAYVVIGSTLEREGERARALAHKQMRRSFTAALDLDQTRTRRCA